MPSNGKVSPHLRSFVRESPDIPEQTGNVEVMGEGDLALSWGWVSGKPVFGVSFEWPDGLKRSFRYIHLESDMVWKGDTLTLRFSSAKTYTVTIRGLRLQKLYYMLQNDRMRTIREAARGFDESGDEPLVESIVIEEQD